MAATASKAFQEAVLRKCRESAEMKDKFFAANSGVLEEVCGRVATALSAGGLHVAAEFAHPMIIEKRRAFPAWALTSDTALLTPIGNDAD